MWVILAMAVRGKQIVKLKKQKHNEESNITELHYSKYTQASGEELEDYLYITNV